MKYKGFQGCGLRYHKVAALENDQLGGIFPSPLATSPRKVDDVPILPVSEIQDLDIALTWKVPLDSFDSRRE